MKRRILSKANRNSAGGVCSRSRQDGFTLVELLVVLAIITLIVTLVAPQVLRYLGTARSDATQAQINNIESALELFYIDNFRYPTTEEGLAVLAKPSPELTARWNGPYLKKADDLKDPWGNPYVYEFSDNAVKISSLGRDGKADGTGEDRDISND